MVQYMMAVMLGGMSSATEPLDQTEREALGVILFPQTRIKKTADRNDRGRRGAGHGAEEHAGDLRRECKAAGGIADHGCGPIHDAPPDASIFHNIGSENEEGNGQQREFIDAAEHLHGNNGQLVVGEEKDRRRGGKAECNKNRSAEEEEQEQACDQKNVHFHKYDLPSLSSSRAD